MDGGRLESGDWGTYLYDVCNGLGRGGPQREGKELRECGQGSGEGVPKSSVFAEVICVCSPAVFAQHHNNFGGVSTALHSASGERETGEVHHSNARSRGNNSNAPKPFFIVSQSANHCIVGHVFASSRARPSPPFGVIVCCCSRNLRVYPCAFAALASQLVVLLPSLPSSSSSFSLRFFLSPAIPFLRCAKTLHLRVSRLSHSPSSVYATV